ncbi:MAG: PP2C family protein-serine/threonine phosphatase, partial [Anaeromyxobacteraceae bacterium]
MSVDGATSAARQRASTASEAFRRYQDALVHRWLGTVLAIGFTLIPLFFLLDLLSVPRALLPRFAVYRALSTAWCIVLFFVTRRTRPRGWSFVYGHLAVIVVAGSNALMTVELGGFDSRYYAGLNLVIAAISLLLPWRPIHSVVNGSIVVAIYVGLNAAFGGPFRLEHLVGNLFFMVATVVIAVALTYVRLELVRKEFEVRSELLDANALMAQSRQELAEARDALWGEMEVAKRIQTALLPGDQRAGPYAVAAAMLPAAEVGGDYYDVLTAPGGRRWIAVGDVSGHGVESGLVMMMTQTAILSLVRQDPALGPAGVYRAVNGAICENLARLDGHRYMTLNVVRLDDEGLTLAGKHQDVLVWREAGQRVETVANEGAWIGVVPDLGDSSPELFVPLAPGDAALFFTDGITEARDAAGEMYGEERLAQALARAVPLPPAAAIGAILEEVTRFAAAQDDDRTVMIV